MKKKLALLSLSGVILTVLYMTYEAYQSSNNWIFTITVFGITLAYSVNILGIKSEHFKNDFEQKYAVRKDESNGI